MNQHSVEAARRDKEEKSKKRTHRHYETRRISFVQSIGSARSLSHAISDRIVKIRGLINTSAEGTLWKKHLHCSIDRLDPHHATAKKA